MGNQATFSLKGIFLSTFTTIQCKWNLFKVSLTSAQEYPLTKVFLLTNIWDYFHFDPLCSKSFI